MKKQIFLFHRFAHRRNADASFDSICLACFLTVGSALVDGALQNLESTHHCKPWRLDSYRNALGTAAAKLGSQSDQPTDKLSLATKFR